MAQTSDWKIIKSLRAKYVVGQFFFPLWMFASYKINQTFIFMAVSALLYVFILYKFFLKKLFQQDCPVCHRKFFPQPGGNIFFVGCDNCGAKIGSEKKDEAV